MRTTSSAIGWQLARSAREQERAAKIPCRAATGERSRDLGKRGANHKLLVVVCAALFAFGAQSDAGEGVIFPPNRFDPEEAGYMQSYFNLGGRITLTIDYIQYNHFMAEYWLSINDPRAASPYRHKSLRGIGLLQERASEKEQWLKETLPPPAFKKAHESLQFLASRLRSTGVYEELDPALRASFREMNAVKLEMDKRPERPSDSPPPGVSGTVLIRPFFLPIVYNVTTGQWIISAVVATPLGTVTFNLTPDTPSGNIGVGPSLLKIVIANKAKYVVLKPGANISFRKEELRILDYRRELNMAVLTLEPIIPPQGNTVRIPNAQ